MITVLRLGHRRGRDERISSHVGLSARQLGADRIIYSGEKDENMIESLEDVSERWGGDFEVSYREDFRRVIKDFEGTSVHLTMYGEPFRKYLERARSSKNLLVVVGSQKVPREIYDLVDLNLAVGNQPHSEVAAVVLFLYEVSNREISEEFPGGEVEVVPSASDKKTREK